MKNKNLIRFSKLVIKKNKYRLIITFILALLISSIDLLLPQITRMILDDGIGQKNLYLLIKLIALYGMIKISSVLLDVMLSYLYSIMQNRIIIDLKVKLLNHISKLSGRYYSGIKTGNILSIIESDMFIIKSFDAELIYSIIINFFTAFISIFLLVKMQCDLFLIVLVLQIALTLFQSKITKLISKKSRELRHDAGNISNITQEYISNIMNVVISKSKIKFFSSYLKKERNLINKFIKLDIIMSGNIAISQALSGFITMAIYGFGGYKIINGQMTVGKLIAFQQYANMLIGPCIGIVRSTNRIQQAKASIDRVYSVIDEEIEIKVDNNGYKLDNEDCNLIEFNDVCFKYNEDDNYILKNINIEFKKGETTALVGGSGCGKSTIVNLVYRFWDVVGGEVLINGVNIKDINLKSLRSTISIVTQDLLIYDDTIKNNIKLNNKISNTDLEEICSLVGLDGLITSLEKGLDTIVGEKGIKISGGQKQRIAIARVLASNSKILILDEATSALDNISQKNILKNINKYIQDKVVIIIAHRLSTIKDADNIYVLEQGQVIESGNNEYLSSINGFYKKLVTTKS